MYVPAVGQLYRQMKNVGKSLNNQISFEMLSFSNISGRNSIAVSCNGKEFTIFGHIS